MGSFPDISELGCTNFWENQYLSEQIYFLLILV
jgi:hypothetical protein